MNCWFSLVRGEQAGRPADAVFDQELGKPISLRKGITDLLEGMTDEDIAELTKEESTEMLILLRKVI